MRKYKLTSMYVYFKSLYKLTKAFWPYFFLIYDSAAMYRGFQEGPHDDEKR